MCNTKSEWNGVASCIEVRIKILSGWAVVIGRMAAVRVRVSVRSQTHCQPLPLLTIAMWVSCHGLHAWRE